MIAPAPYVAPPPEETSILFWGSLVGSVALLVGGAVLVRRHRSGEASGLVQRYGAGFNADCSGLVVVDRDKAKSIWTQLMAGEFAQGISPPGAAAAYWSLITEAPRDGLSPAYPGCPSWWTYVNHPPMPQTEAQRAQVALFMLMWHSAGAYWVANGADGGPIWARWNEEAARLGFTEAEINRLAETVHLG